MSKILKKEILDKIIINFQKEENKEDFGKIVGSVENLIHSCIKSKYGNIAIHEDLFNEAVLSVRESAIRFDPENGSAFSTFALRRIKGAITNYFNKSNYVVSAPHYVSNRVAKIKAASSQFACENGREASFDEISNLTGVKPEKVKLFLETAEPFCYSLDAEGLDGDSEFSKFSYDHLMVDEGEEKRNDDEYNLIDKAMETLNIRQRRVINKRYGLDGQRPLSLTQIAEEEKVSTERIRQIQERALKKMKQKIAHKVE